MIAKPYTMVKNLFVLGLLFLSHYSFGQIFELSEKVDSIPSYDNNRKFMAMVNKEYNKLINQKADSILLYYPIEYSSNYAVIFWKKKGISQSVAFYQYHPPKQSIGKEVLKSKALDKVDIKYIYDVFQNTEARAIDTAVFISENNPIYCRFYFDKRKELTAGYRGWIEGRISLDFINAFAEEQHRIVKRELKKSGVKQMQF